jgi:hypothetical protein
MSTINKVNIVTELKFHIFIKKSLNTMKNKQKKKVKI